MALLVRQLPLGPMQNFAYLIGDDATREAMVVDPAWDVPAILEQLRRDQLALKGILVTHTHFDHINGVKALVQATDVPVYVHRTETGAVPVAAGSVKMVGGGEEISFGPHRIRVLHTPGHTPGSSCFLVDDRLVTGDTLFVNACGRCDLPGSDPEQLYRSLDQLARLMEQTTVYPGHDYGKTPTSTIRAEKRQNPFLQLRSSEEFLRMVRGA